MRYFAQLLLGLCYCWTAVYAIAQPSNPAASTINVVDDVRAGQAGYVHYFLIEHSDEEHEYQVGIELADGRIAWSVPDAGVIVSPFIKSGFLAVNGKRHKIRHLYGLRPFQSAQAMQTLRSELAGRVAFWIDNQTPYCFYRTPNGPFCLSCGDFALQVLFPGSTPVKPQLPKDFGPAIAGGGYSTNDLLLYLVGLNRMPEPTRSIRVASLNLPAALREDLSEIFASAEPSRSDRPTMVANQPAGKPQAQSAAKNPPGKVATRRQARKNL